MISARRLSLRRTLHKAMGTGGVPFRIGTEPAKPPKPEIVVLADVSGSVATFSRFTLNLLIALDSRLSRLRAFSFVDGLADITELVGEARSAGRQLTQAEAARGAVRWTGSSDYGRVLREFAATYARQFTRRTVVLVVGDARTNYTDPGGGQSTCQARRPQAERAGACCPQACCDAGRGDGPLANFSVMPSSWHDAIVQMIRDDPGLAPEIAREWAGADLPAGLGARLESPAFNDRLSADFVADVVVSAGRAGEVSHAVIVEAQQQETSDKLTQWPRYAAAAWLMLRCPVTVLVICRSTAVATFYDRPIPTTLPGWTLRPAVIGPTHVPALTDPDVIAASPGLAALSVAVHGRRRGVAQAFMAGLAKLPPGHGSAYYEKAHGLSGPQIQSILEEIMTTTRWLVSSPFAKEHFGRGLAEGKAEGKAEGEADAILLVLQARGLPVTAEQQARITGCLDLDQLKTWVTRAAVVKESAELFT